MICFVWFDFVRYSIFWYFFAIVVWYCLVWFGIVLYCLVWYCMATVLVEDEVWYDRRGSFMPDSVSLVRLELGKFSAAESRSIS